jgi:chromate transporter
MANRAARGSATEVLGAFVRLGLTSFGGPIAHLGYFRDEFVARRGWLDERAYADLVALCQFLPGPASSQVGFAIGLRRAGWPGALAAWLGFTLPSALVMVLFALGLARWGDGGPMVGAIVHALKLVAVAVVAQAVWAMSRALCPDWPRRSLALLAAVVALASPGASAQVLALGLCALIGWRALAAAPMPASGDLGCGVGARGGWIALGIFVALLAGLPLAAAVSEQPPVRVLDAFYRAGALVFGGGHVVLPLLQAGVVEPGWVSESTFLAGYGAAQAVPGPLFTFAAFLGAAIGAAGDTALAGQGAESGTLGAWAGAAWCLVAVFVPGCLVLVGALPFWQRLRERAALRAALAGVSAGVVGVLLAALIDPVSAAALRSPVDVLLAALLLALLLRWRWPPLAVVAVGMAVGAVRATVAA